MRRFALKELLCYSNVSWNVLFFVIVVSEAKDLIRFMHSKGIIKYEFSSTPKL